MTELTDRSIAALRANHDQLAALVRGLSAEQLRARSGASAWSVADVLSHLGSGAEITIAPVLTAVAGEPTPETDNQAIWDRWNALSPEDQAAGFLEYDERYVSAVEAIPVERREELRIDLGFLPEPAPLDTVLGMRLNEAIAHGWDVRVGVDPDATLDEEAADVLATHFASDLGFLLGWVGKAGELDEPTRVGLDGYQLVVDDGVAVVAGEPEEPTARLAGPLEASVRLLTGRLTPEHTAKDVEVTGNVTLEDLRRVFPGY